MQTELLFWEAQWLSGRASDTRARDRVLKPPPQRCVLEQDTLLSESTYTGNL